MLNDLRTVGWVGLAVAIIAVGVAILLHLQDVEELALTPAQKSLLQIGDVMAKGGAGILIGYYGATRGSGSRTPPS